MLVRMIHDSSRDADPFPHGLPALFAEVVVDGVVCVASVSCPDGPEFRIQADDPYAVDYWFIALPGFTRDEIATWADRNFPTVTTSQHLFSLGLTKYTHSL